MNKVVANADEAIRDLQDGAVIMSGGFGLCGNPENLIRAIHRKGVKNLTIISNNCGTTDKGLGILLQTRQVRKMISSYVGENKEFERQFLAGELEVELREADAEAHGEEGLSMPLTREQIAARAAQELRDGYYVNLGIGMPTLVANYVPKGIDVIFQSENGMLGIGSYPTEAEIDPDLINAGKETVTEIKGTSYFSSADSFAMIRGGHIDIAILGAMEVSEQGDIANWTIPGEVH